MNDDIDIPYEGRQIRRSDTKNKMWWMMTKGITQHHDICVGIWKTRKGRESMTTRGRHREKEM